MSPSRKWLAWLLLTGLSLLAWRLWRREERRQQARGVLRQKSLAQPQASASRLSLNHARLEALQSLPGVGPVLAERIVAARPYEVVEDLYRVEGIGEVTFAALDPLVKP